MLLRLIPPKMIQLYNITIFIKNSAYGQIGKILTYKVHS